MKKIHLELELTEEQLNAFLKTMSINTNQSDELNGVSLNPIWEQIYEQIEPAKYLLVEPTLTLQAYMDHLRDYGFDTRGNYVVCSTDERMEKAKDIISSERVFGWGHNSRNNPQLLLVKHFSICDRDFLRRLKLLECLRCVWVECNQEYKSMKEKSDYLSCLVDQKDIVRDYCPACFDSGQHMTGPKSWIPCPVCCNRRD